MIKYSDASIRSEFNQDMQAILNCNVESIYTLITLIRAYTSHVVLEQYLKEPERTELVVRAPGIGVVTLQSDSEDNFSVKELRLGDDLKRTLRNTIRTKESAMYEYAYRETLKRLGNALDRYAEDGR